MKKIAIVYHSGMGHTEKQAQYVHKGANAVAGINASLFRVEDLADEAHLLNTMDAIIFGSPTYLGNVSSPFKEFMDSTSQIWAQQDWKNKIAGGFTNSHSIGGDKLSTLVSMAIFAAQHAMIWVGQSEMSTSPVGQQGHPEAINRSGTMLGATAQSDDAPSDITPPIGDLNTAELFGKRIAELTIRFN
jgi:multimeric flavodoxin WrbA